MKKRISHNYFGISQVITKSQNKEYLRVVSQVNLEVDTLCKIRLWEKLWNVNTLIGILHDVKNGITPFQRIVRKCGCPKDRFTVYDTILLHIVMHLLFFVNVMLVHRWCYKDNHFTRTPVCLNVSFPQTYKTVQNDIKKAVFHWLCCLIV